MNGRRAILKSLAVMPLATMLGTAEAAPSGVPTGSARIVSKMTAEGLVFSSWSDIRRGDKLCLTDWENGRIVQFTFCTAEGEPSDGRGSPVEMSQVNVVKTTA